MQNGWELLQGISMIIAGASIIVKLTPNKKDDAIVGKIQKFLNLIALNSKK